MLTKITSTLDSSNKKRELKAELISFGKVQREDRNILLELTRNSGSIIDVRSRQIQQILNNIAQKGDTEDISLLLSIAKNLKYGYSENSPMGQFLNTSSNINTQKNKQNNNWSKMLENTISTSLEKNNSSEKTDLINQFKSIYSTENLTQTKKPNAQISGNPIFQQQTKAIKLRTQILETKEFNSIPEGLSPKELEDFNIDQQRVKRNIDYFLASSECPLSEKVQILEKLSTMMSPEYQINEQLKDKKVKVLSEIMNDLVLKTPEDIVPKIKDVHQHRHGMCSAISRARKAVAYEDKLAYVNAIYSELDNKQKMEVFDITKLGQNKKMPVKKTYIDFDSLQKNGYRIVDASTLQWMHISGTIGDGSKSVEKYIPYDSKNYGMFNDSKLIADLPEELLNEHNYLRSLIKTMDDIKEAEESMITQNLEKEELRSQFTENLALVNTSYNHAEDALKKAFPTQPKDKIKNLAYNIVNIEELNNSQLRVHPKESEALKKQKIRALIKDSTGNVESEQLKTLTDKLYLLYGAYTEAKAGLQKQSNMHLHKKADYYRKLFRVAADDRVCTERALDVPDIFQHNCRIHNIPNNNELTISKIDSLINSAQNDKNIEQISQKLGINPSKEAVLESLNGLKKEMTIDIPAQADKYLEILGDVNRAGFLSRLSQKTIAIINNEELGEQYIDFYANKLNVSPDKDLISEKLISIIEELETGVSEKRIGKIASIFDLDSQIEMVKVAINAKASVQLTEEEIDSLAEKMGIEPYTADIQDELEKMFKNADVLENRQQSISKLVEAPTAKELILKTLENKGSILSRTVLDRLYSKFETIDLYRGEIEKAKANGTPLPSANNIYKFDKKDIDEFKNIKTSFSKIRKNVEKAYKISSDSLSESLQELYAQIGVRKGMFWMHEEGHSGLYSSEHVRIAEQISGKPHYIDEDIEHAIQRIKKTGTSGVTATNVMYGEYSGHAQYVADVKTMPIADPKTGKIEHKEVLFHDNSWGPRERFKAQFSDELNSSWKDLAGYERTDYAREAVCGGPNGFILDTQNLRTGIPIDNLKTDMGTNKPDLPSSKRLSKLVNNSGNEYAIFSDIILQGKHPKLAMKYLKLSNNIFAVKEQDEQLTNLLSIIKKHPGLELDIEKMDTMDEASEKLYDQMIKFIKGENYLPKKAFSAESLAKMSNEEKIKSFGIDSKEAFDSIPENHKLKLILRKIGLYDLPYGLVFNDELAKASNHQELDAIEDSIVNTTKKAIVEMIKTIKKPMDKIKSIEDIKSTFGNSEVLIDWISKKFNPATDEELIKQFINLHKLPQENLTHIVNDSTRSQLSIENADGYNFIQKLRVGNNQAENSFNKAIFYDTLGTKYGYFNAAKNPLKQAEQYYRQLQVTMSYLDTKIINKFKEEAFRKYQARPAIPKIPIFETEAIDEKVQKYMEFLREATTTLAGIKRGQAINNKGVELINTAKTIDINSSEDVNAKLKPLLKEIDELCPEEEPEVKSIVQNAINASKEEFPSKLELVKELVKELTKNYPPKLLKSRIDSSIKNINAYFEAVIQSNIQPRYQGRVKELVNEAMSALMKDNGATKPKTNEVVEALESAFKTKSIFENPKDILRNIIHEATHPNKNKDIHNEIMTNLQAYAQRAITVGNLSEIEYRIMENIDNGNINQFKNFMKEDALVLLKSKKHITMDSTDGVKNLIYNLLDPESDNRTFKLVIDSMGLNEQVMKVLMDSTNTEKHLKELSRIVNLEQQYSKENMKLEKVLESIILENKPYKSKTEALKTVIASIDKELEQTPEKKSKFVSVYKKEFARFVHQHKDNSYDGSIIELIDQARYSAAQQGALIIQDIAENIDAVFKDLQDVKELTNAIRLPENSKLVSRNNAFQTDLDSAIKQGSKIVENLVRNLAK